MRAQRPFRHSKSRPKRGCCSRIAEKRKIAFCCDKGIRIVKFYAWEKPLSLVISGYRIKELENLFSVFWRKGLLFGFVV